MDASGSPVYSLIGSDIPGLTINTDGSWSFDPANVAYDDLGKDELKTISVSYSVTDDRGAVDTGTFTINLTGTNDAPEATYTTDLSVLEGASDASGNALVLSGQLTATDVDTDASGLTFSLVDVDASGTVTAGSAIAGLTLNSDGSFSFDPTATAYNSLADGGSDVITINYQVTDNESGTSAVESFNITVLGTNDGPVADYSLSGDTTIDSNRIDASGNLTVSENEFGLDASGNRITITGKLSSTDVDASGSPVYSLIGSDIPGLTINTDGSWSFDPANVAYDDLGKDELKTISVSYSVTDDRGAVDTGTFTINLTGTNDAPEATYTTDLSVLEGASDASGNALVLSGQLTATDVDTDASGLTFSLVDVDASGTVTAGSAIAGLTLNSDGSFSFDPTATAYNSLADGGSDVITINYQVTDNESGTSAVESFNITVLGTNDGPVADYSLSGDTTIDSNRIDASGNLTVSENEFGLDASGNRITITGKLSSTDVDASGSPVYSLIGSDIPGLTINTDGSWSFDPANVAYDDLGKDELKTISVSYSVTDDRGAVDTGTFTINLTGTNDAPEATYTTDLSVLEGASDASGNALVLSGQLTATDVDTDASGLTFSLVDVDASGTVTAGSAIAGLTLNSDGSFSFDPTATAYNSLADGGSDVITINYQVTDNESGTSAVESFNITVLGTNDGPVADYSLSGDTTIDSNRIDASGNLTVSENEFGLDASGNRITITGKLSSTDVDASGSPVYSLIGSDIPGLTINTDGSWSFDPANVAYDDLGKDELKTISVSYSVTDDRGAVDTGTFTINLTGTNDAPEATYTTDLSVLEGASDASGNALVLSGQLTATDVDTDASGLTFSLVDVDASGTVTAGSAIAGLTLNSDGSFSFDPTATAYNSLADGGSDVITINYQVTDNESGTSAVESFNITVLGTNDGPVADYSLSGDTTIDSNRIDASGNLTVSENEFGLDASGNRITITGKLSSTDVDASGSPVYSLIGSDIPGLTINTDGSWSFDPANVAYDDLGKDELKTISVSYSVTDDRGAVDTGTFTINLTGTNDAPEATYTTDLSVLEGASDASGNALVLSGQLTATDVDTDASGLTFSLVDVDASGTVTAGSAIAGLTLNSDGSFSFDPTATAYNSLADGGSDVITINYQVTDNESGTSAVESFNITVLGTNDGPVADYSLSGDTTIDSNRIDASGNLTVSENEFGLDASGNRITITGKLSSTDVDASGSPVYSLIGSDIPGLTINTDGSWSFDPANVAYDDLGKDELKTISVSYSVTDDRGAVDTGTFTINLTGTNDAPEATYTTDLSVLEGASDASGNALVLSGQLTATDVDTDASGLTFSLVDVDASGTVTAGSAIAGLTLNSDGSFSFDPTATAYNSLADGGSDVITINYQVTDNESGTSAVESFNITVLGTNDGPVADYSLSGDTTIDSNRIDASGNLTVSENEFGLDASGNRITITGKLSSTDVDASGSPVYSLIGSDIPGLTINTDGSWSFDPANVAYDDLGKDELKTISVSYSVTDDRGAVDTGTFTINLTGTNDAPEATYTTDLSVLEGASDASGNALVLSGQLTATDVDTDASGLTFSLVDVDASGTVTAGSAIAGLTLNSDGSFSFDPTATAYNSLADGGSDVITINYQVTDNESGTSAVESFNITVLGTNDGPVADYSLSGDTTIDSNRIDASGNLTVSENEFGLDASGNRITITGKLSSTDVDASGSPVYSLIGSDIPGLTINTDGSWSFDPANVAYDDLGKDELKTISVSYSVTDDRGAVDTGTFTINLTGTNDAPEATYTTDLSVLEGASDASGNALLLSGQLSATDVDTDASGLTYTLVADASGNTVDASGNAFSIDGLSLDSDGSFTFDPTNSAYNYLSDGATERITVNYQVADDESGTSSVESFDITVLGTNDGPTATYASGLSVTEGAVPERSADVD